MGYQPVWFTDDSYTIGDPEYGHELCKVVFLSNVFDDDQYEILERFTKQLVMKMEEYRKDE